MVLYYRKKGELIIAENQKPRASCRCSPVRDIIKGMILLWY